MKREQSKTSWPLAVLGAVLSTSVVHAQDSVDDEGPRSETLVTARKWEETLEDVPGSITVVGGDDIEASGWKTLRDASAAVPNLYITEFTSRRLSFPFIRGVGSGQGDPAVITYIDGVPQFGSGGLNLPLFDVERVEFLRGPQGTLYGRNSLGGLLHVITRRPSPTGATDLSAAFGNFDQQEYTVSASGPLGGGDGPLFGFSGLYSKRDGFTKNNFTGNDVDFRDAYFGRGQVVFTPGDDSEVRLSVFGEHADDGGFVLSELNALEADPHRINQDFEGVAQRDVVSPSLTWERLGDTIDFVSISSFQYWDIRETSDFDFSPIDGVRRRTDEEQRYLYQEMRLSSSETAPVNLGDGKEMRWLVGLSGFYSDSERAAQNDFRPDGEGIFFPVGGVGQAENSGQFDDVGFGLFGQATVTFDEKLDLTAGLRFDYESKDADLRQTFVVGGFPVLDVSTDADDDFDELLPHFSAAYHVDEDLTVYGLASRGFKAGGFNLSAPAGFETFDTETNWTYEVGAKASTANGRIDVNASAFYIDWEDMQLSQFDAMAGGFVTNAGESNSKGLELEVQAAVNDSVTLYTAAGYVDTEFDEFVDQFGTDVSGNDLPFAPETTWSLGARARRELVEGYDFYFSGDVTFVGEFFYDPSNLEDESYRLVNFQAGVRHGHWGFDVSLRNAFDEEYVPIALQISPLDPTVFIGESGAPRTLLATLRYGT